MVLHLETLTLQKMGFLEEMVVEVEVVGQQMACFRQQEVPVDQVLL
jgi:hypothetical protein